MMLPGLILLISCAPSSSHFMQITLQRTGGFAGIPMTKSVDSAKLPPAEADRLRQMVESAGFFQLSPHMTAKPAPDRFQYLLTVTENGKSHSVSMDETALPPALKSLVEWLMRRPTP